ncbi:6038_t:CDS:2 [Ambispora leptoticha]|uniref:6038_t:CDS:1 n=1 Tax=Ambispora leptoticha TaxID=144679 RepID=A0A9N9FNK9_9GLOM|nr:6038_t:CDS:2 [Ambispora leptoticha]
MSLINDNNKQENDHDLFYSSPTINYNNAKSNNDTEEGEYSSFPSKFSLNPFINHDTATETQENVLLSSFQLRYPIINHNIAAESSKNQDDAVSLNPFINRIEKIHENEYSSFDSRHPSLNPFHNYNTVTEYNKIQEDQLSSFHFGHTSSSSSVTVGENNDRQNNEFHILDSLNTCNNNNSDDLARNLPFRDFSPSPFTINNSNGKNQDLHYKSFSLDLTNKANTDKEDNICKQLPLLGFNPDINNHNDNRYQDLITVLDNSIKPTTGTKENNQSQKIKQSRYSLGSSIMKDPSLLDFSQNSKSVSPTHLQKRSSTSYSPTSISSHQSSTSASFTRSCPLEPTTQHHQIPSLNNIHLNHGTFTRWNELYAHRKESTKEKVLNLFKKSHGSNGSQNHVIYTAENYLEVQAVVAVDPH